LPQYEKEAASVPLILEHESKLLAKQKHCACIMYITM